MCVLPNKNSSLLSSCRFSKDSWVRFRSWSRSQVRHWSRWPLVVRPPSNSCQINQSCWVVWRAWHTSLPRTLSFCLSSSCPLSFTHTHARTLISKLTAVNKATSVLAVPTGHKRHSHLENPFPSLMLTLTSQHRSGVVFFLFLPFKFLMARWIKIVYLFVRQCTYQNVIELLWLVRGGFVHHSYWLIYLYKYVSMHACKYVHTCFTQFNCHHQHLDQTALRSNLHWRNAFLIYVQLFITRIEVQCWFRE